MRDEDGLLQAGEMVDEEYGLKAVDDGENRPALLLLDHGHILAARGAGVNFLNCPSFQRKKGDVCLKTMEVARLGRLWYAPHEDAGNPG